MKRLVYILMCVVCFASLSAQNLTGKTDKKQYMVGDRINYSFSIPLTEQRLNLSSAYQFSDTLKLVDSKIDTAEKQINYSFVFTSFVDGQVKLPEFQFYKVNDTIPIYNVLSPTIEITMPTIDTTKVEVKPLKSIIKVPLTLKEIIPFSLGGLVLAGIVIAIVYLIRHKDKRPKILQPKPEEIIPEDKEALDNLSRLRRSKFLDNGQVKRHYVILSEILWQYLHRRYDVNAFEMTTEQIMESLQHKQIDEGNINILSDIFTTSDLVKFAKHIPDMRTNLNLLQTSEDFVNNTKRVIIDQESNTNEKSTNDTTTTHNDSTNNSNVTQKEEEVKHE